MTLLIAPTKPLSKENKHKKNQKSNDCKFFLDQIALFVNVSSISIATVSWSLELGPGPSNIIVCHG